MHPPFSPRGENGPCTVQKTRQEGDFGLPLLDLPFKRHKEGAAAPSLETPPRSGSGARGKAFRQAPWNEMPRYNLRHKRGWRGALQRTRMELGKLAESWLSAVRIPKLARTGKFGRSGFFFHRARRILFRQDEKEWGVQTPRRKSAAHAPVSGTAYDTKQTR